MYEWNKMKKFIILIPLFNDWKSVSRLLNEIDLQVNKWKSEILEIYHSSQNQSLNDYLIGQRLYQEQL